MPSTPRSASPTKKKSQQPSLRWQVFAGILVLTIVQSALVTSYVGPISWNGNRSDHDDAAAMLLTNFQHGRHTTTTTTTNSPSSTLSNTSTTTTTMSIHPTTPGAVPVNSSYAYAFLIAGCGDSQPGYRGFLWGAMVTAEILRAHGSTADIVVLLQMANDDTTTTIREDPVLRAMRIRTVYIPPHHPDDTFYDAVLEKFRILQLVEYKKVLFLDADIMPIDTHFDYMMMENNNNNNNNTLLQPNVVRATRAEPANAGFFVLAPGPGKWEQLQEIVERREISAYGRHRNFDFINGWGANMRKEGGWKGTHQKSLDWKFWFAAADQGLLYYWAKYVEKNVTLLIGDVFENWGSSPTTDRPVLLKSFPAPFDISHAGLSSQPNYKADFRCPPTPNVFEGKNTAFCHEPVKSLHHFYGTRKPWIRPKPKDVHSKRDSTCVFFHYLELVNSKYGLGLDMNNWDAEREKIKSSPMGASTDNSFWGDLGRRMERRKPYLQQRAKELNMTLNPHLAANTTAIA